MASIHGGELSIAARRCHSLHHATGARDRPSADPGTDGELCVTAPCCPCTVKGLRRQWGSTPQCARAPGGAAGLPAGDSAVFLVRWFIAIHASSGPRQRFKASLSVETMALMARSGGSSASGRGISWSSRMSSPRCCSSGRVRVIGSRCSGTYSASPHPGPRGYTARTRRLSAEPEEAGPC